MIFTTYVQTMYETIRCHNVVWSKAHLAIACWNLITTVLQLEPV